MVLGGDGYQLFTQRILHVCTTGAIVQGWTKPSSLRKKGASSASRARKRPDSGDQQEIGGPANNSIMYVVETVCN